MNTIETFHIIAGLSALPMVFSAGLRMRKAYSSFAIALLIICVLAATAEWCFLLLCTSSISLPFMVDEVFGQIDMSLVNRYLVCCLTVFANVTLLATTFENLLEITPGEKEFDFMNALVEGVKANVEAIDGELSAFVRGWSLDRLTRVDLAILRIATWELTQAETSERVVINEAVELANQYSTDKAGAFINGVLGSLLRARQDGQA